MNSSELRDEYEQRRPKYCDLVREVEFALRERLRLADVKTAGLLGRTKTIESLIEKVQRKKYANPLDDIDDLAGVRVICLYEWDLKKVKELIEQTFSLLESEDKTDDLGLDRMGYQGQHYVVSLSPAFSGPRYDPLHDLRCEIQVRTIMQDAWAQVSHNLVYKSEGSIPQSIRRQLNNVSSLLEVAQSVFDSINHLQSNYTRLVKEKEDDVDEFLAQDIDRETLAAYTKWKYPDLPLKMDIQELALRDLDQQRYRAIKDIDRAVDLARDAVELYRSENPSWFTSGTDFVTKSLGFSDEVFQKKHPFGTRTREAFRKYAHKVKR